MDTTGKTVISGARGTIATALITKGLETMTVEEKGGLFKSLNGLIRTKQGIKAYKIDITTGEDNIEPSMKWTDIGSDFGATAFKVGSFLTSKIESPLERVARSLRDIYKKEDGSTLKATNVNETNVNETNVNETTSSPTDIGDLYLSVAKKMSILTRPAEMLFTANGVQITKKVDTPSVTLKLSTEFTAEAFVSNILLLYARMED
jgi:hypothetical protein